MSNIIDLLESIGTDARLRLAPRNVIDQAMQASGIAIEQRQAVLDGHAKRLEEIVGASTNICCGMHPPSPPDDDEDEEEEEEDQDTKPSIA